MTDRHCVVSSTPHNNRMVAEIRMKTDKKSTGTTYYRFAVSMKAAGAPPARSDKSIDDDLDFLLRN